jgi:hypothetical protein
MKSTYDRDAQAIAAIGEALGAPGPAGRLGKLLAEQEAAARPRLPDLSPAQRKLREEFERDNKVLANRVVEELKVLDARFRDQTIPFAQTPNLIIDSTFSPNGPLPYTLSWTQIDGFPAAGDSANADIHSGTYYASRYTTSGELDAYAGLGAWITPQLPSCRLWVRPYVAWSGYDILQTRIYDPNVNEQRWAVAQVQLGIFIQSWDLSGGSFNSEPPTWVLAWNRSELNPSGSRNYQDNAFAGDYIQYAPATSSRQYAIWAVCRVTAIAQAGFAVDTRASASVSCKMPFLLVGQIPN